MYQEILDNGGFTNPKMLNQYFIFGLGPEFSEIIRHVNTNTLPPEWQPLDLHSLIPVAKRYLSSVLSTRERNREYKEAHKSASNSSSQTSNKTSSSKPSNNSDAFKDRTKRIYTAIYNRCFRIGDFEHEVGAGCCVFHGTRDHRSEECLAIKKAIEKNLSNNSNPQPKQNKQEIQMQPVAKVASTQHDALPDTVLSQTVDFSTLQGIDSNSNHSIIDDVNA